VHQPGALALRVAQHLEHAVEMARGARAALHREPHGLVQHQHVGVLVERDRLEEIAGLGIRLVFRRARPGLVQAQRRDTHRLSGSSRCFGLRALAVHAQLAFADHALDMGERQPGETRLEERSTRMPASSALTLAVCTPVDGVTRSATAASPRPGLVAVLFVAVL
jgi:hypothetical protein